MSRRYNTADLQAQLERDKEVEGSGTTVDADRFFAITFLWQTVMIIMFALCTGYGAEADISKELKDGEMTLGQKPNLYATFQDVHVMMFIGFGFLMTFLKKYGLSSLSFNFLVTVFAIQWNILTSGTEGFWKMAYNQHWHEIGINTTLLIESDFAAACCLISMGAVLGKTNAVQLVLMVIFEMFFFNANLVLCFDWLKIHDQGGSIVVHTFGAFFGLAASYVLSPKAAHNNVKDSSTRTSDSFAMIGTLFLWMFWPSFNGALATGQMQSLVVLNTTLALCGSAVATFLFSAKFRGRGKFDMVDVQNATLAGGVAVGSASNMLIHPAGAIGLGFVAGCFCVVGYTKIQPALQDKVGLHDTCGVQNLHGYSGIMGAVASAVTLAIAKRSTYGVAYDGFVAAHGSPGKAAAYQIAALFLTLAIAISTGLFTGAIMKRLTSPDKRLFEDAVNYEIVLNDTDDEPLPQGSFRIVNKPIPAYNIEHHLDPSTNVTRRIPGATQNNQY